MKAIVQYKYGSPDVLELKDVDKPIVKDDEVLVRVHAASVHPDVWHVVRGLPYVLRIMGAGLLKPKNSVPGADVAGHVESVGKNVTLFQPGDEVFGESVRGHQWHNGGAYAEYTSVPEDQLALADGHDHHAGVRVEPEQVRHGGEQVGGGADDQLPGGGRLSGRPSGRRHGSAGLAG